MKRKVLPWLMTLVTAVTVLLATTTAFASPPWLTYQPKAPKSVIK